MKSRFSEKLLYSFLHRIRCSIVTHQKWALIEEICQHATENSHHHPINSKDNSKLDENKNKKLMKYCIVSEKWAILLMP